MSKQDLLIKYGYDIYKANNMEIENLPIEKIGRVIACHKNFYDVVMKENIVLAQVAGKYRNNLEEEGGYPVVGDFVAVNSASSDFALIESTLTRTTVFYRKDIWNKSGMQILAANFDCILICSSLNKDFSLKRIERYVALSINSGAKVFIVLTKSDLCSDYENKVKMCEEYFPNQNIQVIAISVVSGMGIDMIREIFSDGSAALLLGSSGVGKSSLVNLLSGKQVMDIGSIREDDDKGKHTTVVRQMICLDQGIIIDTPGLREVGIVCVDDSVDTLFSDIKELELKCKYSDCKHVRRDGCAVLAAIENGTLSRSRYANYLKMQYENRLLNDRGGYLLNKWQRSKQRSKDLREIRKRRKKK